MSIEVGVLVEGIDGTGTVEIAAAAEAAGLDLVAIRASVDSDLDVWTLAAWTAARTEGITIGIVEAPPSGRTRGAAFGIEGGPPDASEPIPSVVVQAYESLRRLAGDRLVVHRADEAAWVVAPGTPTLAELQVLAGDGLPVVIPITGVAGLVRISELARDLRSAPRSRPRRSAEALASRVPGIDYEGVPDSLADAAGAIEPGDRAYHRVSSTYLRGGAPGLVLRPRTTGEVVDAVGFARRHPDVALGIRSAGHGISGRSTNRGGIVIDVGAMNAIQILDHERRIVRIGPGATWKQVAAALHPHGWALGSGDYGGVGVGGLATAGGIGLLSRAHGLTIDHLRAVEMVLADGSVVRADEHEDPELFRAVRGAGANFGIVTAFEFEVDEVDEVGWAKLTLVAPAHDQALLEFGRLASSAPRDTTVFLVTGPPRQGNAVLQLYAMVDDTDPDVIVERLTPFVGLGALVQQDVAVMPYRDVMAEAPDTGPGGHHGFGEPASRSAFVRQLTPAFARDAAALLADGTVAFFQLRAMGGAIADVPADATAFPHRDVAFQVTAMGSQDAALSEAWDGLRHHFDGLYLSFETDRRPERLVDAFTADGLARLRSLKRELDPGNLFRDNFALDPSVEEADAVKRHPALSRSLKEAS